MRKCLKITITGKVQGVAYRATTQKHAHSLNIEGTVQNKEDGTVVIYACGPLENLDKFIDLLYKGTSDSKIDNLSAEPFVNEKDYRGVFRIIGD